jgi:hypothetical protein
MADRIVNPGGFAAAYSAANPFDRLLLQPGLHDLGTGLFTFSKSDIIVEAAAGWSAGQWVTGSNGHVITNVPVRLRGHMQMNGSRNTFRGFGWYDSADTGPGTCIVLGSDNAFEDLVCRNAFGGTDAGVTTNDAGSIFFTIGGPTRPSNNAFRRIRFRLCGNPAGGDHDHPFYIKNCTATLIEDCISYDQNDGWMFHFYPNGDNTTVNRCLAYNVTGGVTFSGANDSSTGLSGCLASDANILSNCILVKANRRWGVESYWGCSTVGINNSVRNSCVYQPPGASGAGRISTTNGGFTTSGIINSDPLFADPANGDFTLSANSPALGMGPTQIQPGGAPPQPPPPVTALAASELADPLRVQLDWTNPVDMTGRVVNIYRSTAGFITNTAGVTPLTTTTDDSYIDSAVAATTTYYYTAQVAEGGLVSSIATQAWTTGSPTGPPPPDDPTGGEEFVGVNVIGTTWRGMSGDYKRASRHQLPTGKRMVGFGAYLRGVGSSGTTACRPFVYDDSTGALLGTFTAEDISDTLAEQWVEFTPDDPIDGPPNGGTIRIGMHTEAGSTLEVATNVVTGALAHGADTYSDGTAATWTTPSADNYLLSAYVLTEDQPSSADLAGSGTVNFFASANATEVPPAVNAITDVEYRDVGDIRTYSVPAPFQSSTGAELVWDPDDGNFYIKVEE